MQFILVPNLREWINGTDDIPIDIRQIISEFQPLFPGGFDTSRFEDLLYPELWFSDTLDKDDRDLINVAIAQYNSLTYNSITELFTKDGILVLGAPLLGKEDPSNLSR